MLCKSSVNRHERYTDQMAIMESGRFFPASVNSRTRDPSCSVTGRSSIVSGGLVAFFRHDSIFARAGSGGVKTYARTDDAILNFRTL